ncbi:lysoplasmalogenase family protein [Brachybacterium squillarum]|uniref:lysoplasmalogenase family protein n=1 Tax=Brachybacterium squillarum TaxID=661979 RepID=UPI000262978D|nr:lysoplasmalogenase family protein [Brachybacterium squillarum]
MSPSRSAVTALWVAYAVIGVTHLGAILGDLAVLQRTTQMMLAPVLLAALLTAAPRLTRITTFMAIGLISATAGDSLSQVAPEAVQQISAEFFLLAIICYSVALMPLWRTNRDPLRLALAIPYGAVVIGLFLACADGAGPLLPLVAAYAIALATMAFLSSGGNGMTWTGGTLFLLSSSVLAMTWFLPGASIGYSTVWVMFTYIVGQAMLVGGVIQLLPERRWELQPEEPPVLVIVEG